MARRDTVALAISALAAAVAGACALSRAVTRAEPAAESVTEPLAGAEPLDSRYAAGASIVEPGPGPVPVRGTEAASTAPE